MKTEAQAVQQADKSMNDRLNCNAFPTVDNGV